jgi:hypothetical protein
MWQNIRDFFSIEEIFCALLLSFALVMEGVMKIE